MTRDQLIAQYETWGKSTVVATARADAEIAAAAALATKKAVAKAACDFALGLKWTPGTPYPGAPVWNDTLNRWERPA